LKLEPDLDPEPEKLSEYGASLFPELSVWNFKRI